MNIRSNSEKLVTISDALDGFVQKFGHFFMWTNGILVFVIIVQVVLRYGFGRGLVMLEELQWHLCAASLILVKI